MKRWTKCILKLFGRGLTIAFAAWILGAVLGWLSTTTFMEIILGLVIILVLLVVAIIGIVIVTAIIVGICSFFEWSWKPPLLEKSDVDTYQNARIESDHERS